MKKSLFLAENPSNSITDNKLSALELRASVLRDKIFNIESEGKYRGRATGAITGDLKRQLAKIEAEIKKVEKRKNGTVANTPAKKRFSYKGFTCIWSKERGEYEIFTKDEMEEPAGFRYPEFECANEKICKEWIDSY